MRTSRVFVPLLAAVLVGAVNTPASSAVLPVDDTNLVVWLRSDNVVLSGTNVTTWTDLTNGTTTWGDGTAQDAGLSDGGPTIVTGAVNGYDAVNFGGGGAYSYAGSLGLVDGFTAIVVGQNNGVTNNSERFFQVGDVASGTNGKTVGMDVVSNGSGNGAGTRYNNGNNLFTPGWETDNGTYHVSVFSMADASRYDSSTYSIDGTPGTFDSSGGSSNIANFTGVNDLGYTFGRGVSNAGGASDWLTGRVTEVLLFGTELSAAELNAVGYYLQQKYSLTGAYTTSVTDVYFDDADPADSNWSTPGNWDIAAEPTASQNAFINNGLTAQTSQSGAVAGTLAVGSSSTGGPGTPGAGTLNVTAGDLTVSGALTLGDATYDGTLNVSGGTVNANGGLAFGSTTSALHQTGGTVNVTGNVTGSLGVVDVNGSGATLTLINDGTAGNGVDMQLGGGATLRLLSDADVDWGQNITVIGVSGGTNIYVDPATTGTNVTHTFGDVTFVDSRDWRVYTTNLADNHTAVFGDITLVGDDKRKGNANIVIAGDISGSGTTRFFFEEGTTTITGDATLTSFRVGDTAGNTGTVTYAAPSGTLDNTGTFYVGRLGNGSFTVDETTSTVLVANRLQVADDGTSTAALNLLRGTIDVNGGGFFVAGNGGTGTTPEDYPNTQGDVVVGTAGGNLTDAQLFTSGGNLEIGRGGTATFTQYSGTVTVETNNVVLGQGSTADGTYTMAGGLLKTTDTGSNGSLHVGNTGKGTFLQTGGEVDVINTLDLGNKDDANSEGTYTLNGGTLTVNGTLLVGNLGTGVFNFEGGTLNFGNTLYVAGSASGAAGSNSNGELTLGTTTGPTVSLTTAQFEVGRHGVGVVNHVNADVTVASGNLVISQVAGSQGTYNISGGTLDVANEMNFNAGTGVLNQSGGTVTVSDGMNMASNSGSGSAEYNMTGGKLIVTESNLELGRDNVAVFNQTGGEVEIALTGAAINLVLGQNATGDGTYNISGPAGVKLTLGNQLNVANRGKGTFVQDGGTVDVATEIQIGNTAGEANTDGLYQMKGGTLTTGTQIRVGTANLGRFEQTGGTVNVGTNLVIGNSDGGDGTYTMNGGILNVGSGSNSDLIIGNANSVTTSAKMEIIDGTVNVGKSIRIADNGGNSSGTLIVGNGTTSPVVNLNTGIGASGNNDGNFETADNGSGTFTLKSGTVVVNDNNLITGQNAGSEATVTIGGFAAPALLDVSGGDGNRDWNTNAGHGIVSVQAGGTIDVGRDINMGSDANANSGLELTVDGGNVNVGTAQPGGGNVNFRAGGPKDNITVQAGTLNTNGGNVVFADATDVLELTGTGKLDVGGGTILVTEADGSQFNFNGGRLQNLGLFSGPSGSTLTTPDVSGTGTPQDGVLASTEPAGAMTFANLEPGKFGGAIDLDGDNDYVDFGTATALGNNAKVGQFSLSLWFNRDVNDTGGANDTNHNVNNVLVGHSRTSGNDHFELGSEGADLEGYVDMDGGTDFTGPISFTQGVVDDTWHHLAVTFDASRTSDELHYFLDGQLVTKNVGDDPDGLASSVAELTLGIARIDGSEKWGDLDGLLDEFSLWSRPLTDAEVARLYNGGAGATLQSLIDDGGDPFSTVGLDVYAPMDQLNGTLGPAVTLVQDGGILAPGASTGISGIAGDYDMNAGILEIELAGSGDVAGVDFDFVDVLGDASLDGQLQVSLLGGYSPPFGTTFDVLTAQNIALGANFGIDLSLVPGYGFYSTLIPGGNGQILQLTAVPEPSTAVGLFSLIAVGIVLWRRRRS